ncbi:DUF4158 domain-containing protein [Actinocrinis puniceicyclus]|uniref:DUF4158 domain-containing protein n=1 Tax=Actinocrinis puniceicyclus TaxID=977794 RepID=A0A8J7WSM0_9ACTN|nr:DUF4158 domain-containing protein [Actinocrinis puniceicyclus]MBS2965384.1 DUF4158 domain-containing protein [Actinocrinis puniceicyclus]
MSVKNLSDEQVARYGRFAGDPTPQELEEFFFLDDAALEFARTKRRGCNRLGWAVQWGTVRMLGMFLIHPSQVPDVVAAFVAEQLGGVEASALKQYPDREQTRWDHSREIRDLLGLREFDSAELELRAFVAGRVGVSNEGPRALFDRAVVWLIKHRVLLPRITTLVRLVPEVRTGEMALINSVIDAEVSPELRRTLLRVLDVPDGDRVSTLERWRTPVRDVSGRGQRTSLLLAQEIRETNGRAVDLWRVPEVKTTELARFGLATKAPKLRQFAEPWRTATLLSTVRHLESASIDDALTLFDVLMVTKLLARAQRADVKEKLRTWPKLRKAATKVGKAVEVLLETPAEAEGAAGPISVAEAWTLIEQVVTRQELIEAMAELAEVLPPAADGDGDAQWRTQLMERYATVRPFIAAEVVLAELVVLLARPAQPGRFDQPGHAQHLSFGHVAVVEGQLAAA